MSIAQRKNAINSAISNILVLPVLVFQILLAEKLDHDDSGLSYFIIAIPLMVTFFSLMLLSFCSKGSSNKFWFGMRKSNFLLNALGEYGNINVSYRNRNQIVESGQSLDAQVQNLEEKSHRKNLPIMPHFAIDTPD